MRPTFFTVAALLVPCFAAPQFFEPQPDSDLLPLIEASKTCRATGIGHKFPREIANPEPSQRYFYTQLTQPLRCEENEACEIAAGKVYGKSIAFSASVEVFFFSAGFEVGFYSETSETPNCAGAPGDTICVWQRVAHTRYNAEVVTCGAFEKETVELAEWVSPNIPAIGSAYLCGKNAACQYKDAEFWSKMDEPGGPKAYPLPYDEELSPEANTQDSAPAPSLPDGSVLSA